MRKKLVILLSAALSLALLSFVVYVESATQPAAAPSSTEVTNTNDSGAGSLRDAITNANANAGVDTVSFNIPGAAPFTINLASALPTITDPVIFDGTTQTGFAGTPIIELNGTGAGAGVSGLTITAGSSTVKALVINRFTANGIVLQTSGSNTVAGCYIGTDVTGTLDLGNSQQGVRIDSSANNTVGGVTGGSRNVISGNNQNGIFVTNAGATGTVIQGNYIGTNAAGTSALGNTQHGVTVFNGAANNQIGGTTAAARNVISGNGFHGVNINGSTGNIVQGNFIGTDTGGTTPLGNSLNGIAIGATVAITPSNNIIGGAGIGEGNVIAYNAQNGVLLFDPLFPTPGTSNSIRGNSIFSNSALGIDLNNDGATANDGCDGDTGPNNFQNFPVLTSAVSAGGSTTIQGTLSSTASSTFTIDFYSNPSCDSSGNGEGKTYLGSTSVNTDGSCNATINATLPVSVSAGQVITATATDAGGNTSEFSACVSLCGSLLTPLMNTTGVSGASDTVTVATNCAWTAVSNDAWITVNSGASGNGNGTVGYSVAANAGASRSGSITIAGLTFSVKQSAAAGFTIAVTNTNDDGTGSLRQAIDDANANAALDTISFNITGTAPFTINLASGLPLITDPVIIDGTTQPGFAGSPIVELNGAGAGSAQGLNLQTGSNTVKSLVINRFALNGILFQAGGNMVAGCYIGTDVAGAADLGNTNQGIRVDDSPNNLVGGTAPGSRNVISGNGLNGILVINSGSNSNQILGNYIGIDASGAADLGNALSGVFINNAPNTVVGGTTVAARNVISGNDSSNGIRIDNAGATGTVIQGNYIGTNFSGAAAIPHFGSAIRIANANGTTIGGTAPGAGNLLSGNSGSSGINLIPSSNNVIQGNMIGTNAAGNGALPNNFGIQVVDSSANNLIGGTTAAARNIISGNQGAGVLITGFGLAGTGPPSSNIIQGNYIGTDITGNAPLGNGEHGVELAVSGSGVAPVNNTIGGVASGAGNIIAFNTGDGVSMFNPDPGPFNGTGNSIRGNSIHSNTELAIDLQNDGVTANDSCDADGDANNLQNFPVLTSAVSAGGSTTIQGTLNSAANSTFTIDFYSSSACDGSGNGEGQTYLGSATVNTNGSCSATINATLPVPVPAGQSITATATDLSGNTSEFSACIAACGSLVTPLANTFGSSGGSDTAAVLTNCAWTAASNAAWITITSAASGTGNGTVAYSIAPNAGATRVGTMTVAGLTFTVTQSAAAGFTITVTNTNDSGAGSLRQALLTANGNAGPDTITFNIPGSAPFTISPASALPVITDPVIIDGTTQPGFSGSPIIELNGTSAGTTISGLAITSGSSAVRGLVINRFNVIGIFMQTNGGNTIAGCYLGTDITGTLALPNTLFGVMMDGSAGNTIGGTAAASRNVISGNSSTGVQIVKAGSIGNTVLGNFIGTTASGAASLGNSGTGVFVSGVNNVIGGTAAGARNIISGNGVISGAGVSILGNDESGPGTGNVVQGNYIGTDVTGTISLFNKRAGVALGAPNNTVGGTVAAARNVISGNHSDPGFGAVQITGTAGAGGLRGHGSIVQGNFIGTKADGVSPLANAGDGILVAFVQGATIGGTAPGAANVIAFNANHGIALFGGTGNTIRGNSIFSNGGLGFDLSLSVLVDGDGVTANDSCDMDAGPNNVQNFPVLTSAASGGGNTTIQGSLNSTASSAFNIDFYSTPSCDGSGNGEGQVYLGSGTVNTDGSCNAAINVTLPVSVAAGHVITAAATDSNGNTSEFSACAVVCGYSVAPLSQGFAFGGGSNTVAVTASCPWTAVSNDAWITITGGSSGSGNGTVSYSVASNPGSPRAGAMTIAGITFTVTQGSDTPINTPVNNTSNSGPGSLRDAIAASNANYGQTNTIQFPVSGDLTINLTSPLPPIDNPVVINGLTTGGRVTLDGTSAGANASGLTLTGGGSTISGLNINNFSGAGISLEDNGGNTIQDVRIGASGGSSPSSNTGDGIVINSNNNLIGGATPATANIITSNGGKGISILAGTGNQIRINSIDSNGGLGVDLGNDGVTPNDTGDPDADANNLQNYPVLTSAESSEAGTTMEGTLNSTASAAFTIDFYFSTAADPTGFGEGQTYLGSTTVNTNGSGDASFNVNFAAQVMLGKVITALARNNASGDSSEFSQAQTVAAPTAVTLVSFTATAYDTGVFIEWRTGLETDNLGFNIYRDQGGKRSLVNNQPVAGSALRDGAALRAGESYAWWDNGNADCGSRIADCKNALYWLEDVDLKGASTWHGPFAAKPVGGVPPARSNAATISKIGSIQAEAGSTRVVESTASLSPASSAQASVQTILASQPAMKISVRREGWYRVTQPELAAAGLTPKGDPRFLQLFVDGREMPIQVSTSKDGSFDQSSAIEFYGIGLDSPSSDARTYWLVAGDRDGKRIVSLKPEGESSSAESFTQTAERKDRTIYFSSLRNGDKENFFGAIVAGEGAGQTLSLANLAQFDSSNFETTLEVALQGVTLAPHRVLVQLNGTGVSEVSFDGQQQGIARFNVSHSLLREGGNTVRLVPQNGAGDVSLVDHIRISYQHAFAADDDALRFTASGGRRTTVAGFSSRAVRAFDVTDASNVQELIAEVSESKNGFAATIAPHEPGVRTLIAMTDEKAQSAFSLEANRASSWRSPANAADLVIITTPDLLGAIGPLKDLRQAERYKVALVDVGDIYDEFTFGHKSPQAIKDFLSYAASSWKLAPRFVLFAGDASFDARNYLGLGYNDLVPTKLLDTNFLETASDDWFADFNNDGVAEMAVGRLPVRDAEEAATAVSKLINYSRSKSSASVALVSDANDGFNFEQASAQLRPLLPSTLKVEEVRRGELDPATAKARLVEAINRGQKLINYVGHGSANQWRGDLLTSADASALTNGDRLPVFVMMTCLNGYFHDAASNSLAESLLKAENGGAIAVWASSGMTFPEQQALINQQFYRLLFSAAGFEKDPAAVTLGEATRRAKSAALDKDTRLTWILLGDPTTILR